MGTTKGISQKELNARGSKLVGRGMTLSQTRTRDKSQEEIISQGSNPVGLKSDLIGHDVTFVPTIDISQEEFIPRTRDKSQDVVISKGLV